MNKELKILIVDDNYIDQKQITRSISKSDLFAKITVVSSGAEALEILKKENFDCCFFDYLLQDINGIELVKLVREKNNEVPIIIITSQTDQQLSTKAISAGASNYLIKDLITPQGMELIIRNTLNIQKIEIQLKEAKKEALKQAQYKQDFLANMSHEIRTPLNAIIGFNELLKQTSLNEIQKNYLDIVSTASENLLVIINDVLDTAKLESGKLALEKKPIDIKQIAERVINFQSNSAKIKGLNLSLSIDKDIPNLVFGDETRLMQILINLIGNAIKFTDSGSVELQVVLKSSISNQAEIFFNIKDTGIGIDKSKFKAIFERFSQAESSTTRLYGGTGLGLNIVKNIIELFNGQLEVKSEIKKGSEFSFIIAFEIASEKDIINKTIQTNDVNFKNIKILLVEDNEHNQLLASTYLKKHNAIVEQALNGEIAINMLKKNSYDVILMDLQMPLMDGYTASKIIRNDLKLDVPIIACSAHSMVGENEKCKDAGMNSYVSKPYTEQNLIEVISNELKIKPEIKLSRNTSLPENKKNVSPVEIDDFNRILKELAITETQEFVDAMMNIYLSRIPADIKEIEKAIIDNNLSLVNQKAHLLVGSLSSMSFTNGACLAIDLEKSAASKNIEETVFLTKKLVSYLNESLLIIKK